VHEITAKLGEVQGNLYELREENIALLEEKRQLKEKLRAAEEHSARRAHYKLVVTAGGAKLPQFDGHDGSLQESRSSMWLIGAVCVLEATEGSG
jgi:hypothetical protein